jgi:lysophospholipase L1-like esterase
MTSDDRARDERDARRDDAAPEPFSVEPPAGDAFSTLLGTPEGEAARHHGPRGRDQVVPVVPERPERALVPMQRGSELLREWGSRDWFRIVAVVAAIAVFAIPVALLLSQRDAQAAAAARQAKDFDAPPITLAGSTPRHTGPVIAIITDESALRSAPGVPKSGRWPALLGSQLDSTVDLLDVDGGGYATTGDNGITFLNSAAAVASDTDVVLFVGGSNDAGVSATALARAANNSVSAANEQAPGVATAMVGPLITDGKSAAQLDALRQTLGNAASASNARWVDPVQQRWLPTTRSSAQSLTASDEKAIASRLAALVKRLAPAS